MSNVIAPIFSLIMILSIFLSTVAFSLENKSPEEQIKSQRSEFLRIEKYVWDTSDEDFAKLVIHLGDYPLVPYLIERKILHGLTTKKVEQVRAFLEEYKDNAVRASRFAAVVATPCKEKPKKLIFGILSAHRRHQISVPIFALST